MDYWVNLPEFPAYSVSDYGFVRNDRTGRILKATANGSQNLIVNLQRNGRAVVKQVKWLVAENFLEPPHILDCIPVFKDRDWTNVAASNLEWMSRSDVHWRAFQERQGYSPEKIPVRSLKTGNIYTNIFECAKDLGGYARHIDRTTRNSDIWYLDDRFEYLYEEDS